MSKNESPQNDPTTTTPLSIADMAKDSTSTIAPTRKALGRPTGSVDPEYADLLDQVTGACMQRLALKTTQSVKLDSMISHIAGIRKVKVNSVVVKLKNYIESHDLALEVIANADGGHEMLHTDPESETGTDNGEE